MSKHIHNFEIESSFNGIHKHKVKGYVQNAWGINLFHIHYYFGNVSYLDHTHNFSGITGAPIKTENGHIHKIEGSTTLSNDHSHKFKGYTYEDTASLPGTSTVGYHSP